MTITLGNTTLCHGQRRFAGADAGKATGPRDLRISETPGVAVREFVGADRVSPEHVLCDSGTVSFGVTRTFATVADALAYATGDVFDEDVAGELKFDNRRVFGAKSAVTGRQIAVVGCTVAVNYEIAG